MFPITVLASLVPASQQIEVHPIHDAVASFGAATTTGAIYILGGHVGTAHDHSRDNLSARFIKIPLDSPSDWTELKGGVGLQSVALVAHEDDVYRVGGMFAKNGAGEPEALESVDAFMRYDERAGEWETVVALPEPRSSHDAIVMDGTLYVLGGWHLSADDPVWHDHGWSLDLTQRDAAWRRIEQPSQRRAIAIAAADGKVWLLGGITPDGEQSDRVEILDVATGGWTEGPPLPVSGFGGSAFGTDEGVFFLAHDGFVYRLDDAGESWKPVHATALPRFFARLVPGGPSRLAVIAGVTPQGRAANLELIPTTPASDRTVVSKISIPFPGDARQRQAAFLFENELYLFGGNKHAEGHHFERDDFSTQGWAVDLLSGTCRRVTDFPAARQSMRTVVLDSTSPIALCGGGYGPDDEGPRSWSDVYTFDLLTEEWTSGDVTLPAALTQFELLEHASALWAVGGIAYWPDRDGDFEAGDAVYRWDVGDRAGFVAASATLKTPRRAFGSAVIDSLAYVVGGMTDDFETVTNPERIDLDSGEVRTLAAPDWPRLGPSVAALAGKVWVTGGTSERSGERAFDGALEAYDPATDRWETVVEALPIPAQQSRILPWGERLVAWTTVREGWIDVAFVTPLDARPEGGGFRHP